MLAKLNTFALVGIDAVPVEAEVDVSTGLPKTVLFGSDCPKTTACVESRGANFARFCGHELGNLRCPGYCNISRTDATWTKARKLAAFLS
jgi:hypothetical protein